jgi:hypothetical protein
MKSIFLNAAIYFSVMTKPHFWDCFDQNASPAGENRLDSKVGVIKQV